MFFLVNTKTSKISSVNVLCQCMKQYITRKVQISMILGRLNFVCYIINSSFVATICLSHCSNSNSSSHYKLRNNLMRFQVSIYFINPYCCRYNWLGQVKFNLATILIYSSRNSNDILIINFVKIMTAKPYTLA